MSAAIILEPAVARRFWAKVELNHETGCWKWRGAVNSRGYGQFALDTVSKSAHRVSYQLHVGAIPEDLQLDHLCGNKRCVNPLHLEPVTAAENLARARAGGLIHPSLISQANAAKTHCKRGHPLAGDNLYTDPKGHRYCRQCKRAADRRRNARLKAVS